MRLNGWMRIGIVLSLIWMAVATAYWFNVDTMEISASNRETVARSLVCTVNCLTSGQLEVLYNRSASIPHAVLISGFLLAVAWALIGISYVSVRWIRAGFKRA